jgi:EamA-like transporter family.
MLFAALIIKEPISFKKASGVIIGMSGAAIILYTARYGHFEQSGTLKGNLVVLISCFVYALYLVIIRPLMAKHSPVHIMKWTFFYGAIIALPFTFDKLSINQGASTTEWMQLGYALVFGTFCSLSSCCLLIKVIKTYYS